MLSITTMLRPYLLFLVVFLGNTFVQAQPDKPKLGLVLSGGGAKGLAHIGVIRELEEQGIYPDYVTGTSMGALIGALYAIGYTPDEMESIVKSINWDELLTNNTPLEEVTIEEKPFAGRYLVELAVQNGKLSLPKGLIEGQKLNELFSRVTRSVHHLDSFSDFPIPFACVATDISTGQKVVLDQGFLPDAMRASMAIPSFFTPVEIDDKLLVDGGLVRNFPVDEVRAMGAEVVIGVFVSEDLKPKEELVDMVEVLSQSAFIFSAFDTREQIKKLDFMIAPDLEGYYSQSFGDGEAIIKVGEESTRAIVDSIRSFKAEYLADKKMNAAVKLAQPNQYEIDTVLVEGNKNVEHEFILGKLNIGNEKSISIDEIEDRIDLLYGTRFFTKINYALGRVDGKRILTLKVEEAPRKKVSTALHYDTENGVGLNVNFTVRNILLKNSRWVLEGDLAEHPRLFASYFQYLGRKQRSAILMGGDWSNLPLTSYDDEGDANLIFGTNYLRYYAQWQSANHQHFTYGVRVAGEWSSMVPDFKVVLENIEVERVNSNNNSVEAFYWLNSLDRRYFPKRGEYLLAEAKYKFNAGNSLDATVFDTVSVTLKDQGVSNYYLLSMDYRSYFSLSEKTVVSLHGTVVFSDLDVTSLNLIDFQFIGGFNPRFVNAYSYWGSGDKQFASNNFSLWAVALRQEVLKNLFIEGRFNYLEGEYPMKWVGLNYEENSFGGENRRFGYGVNASLRSKFGPVMLGVAKDTKDSHWCSYFSIGFFF